MQRIVIVCNPRSSRYARVRKEVLDFLMNPNHLREKFGISGVKIFKYEVAPTDVDDNAMRLSKLIFDDDLVLAVGGDATGVIGLNAVILSGKDVTLAALPYGNFNDLARTLGLKKLEDVFCGQTKKLYPLDILVDDEHFRFASCYVTIGMMAEAVELFDSKKVRLGLRKKKNRAVRSYFELAKWYFIHRHKKEFLPDFELNGFLKHKKSDYIAVNGKSLARVVRGEKNAWSPNVFTRRVGKMTSFVRLVWFMAKGMLFHVTGDEVKKEDTLQFVKPADVEIQAEGEYKRFVGIKKIQIKKDSRFVKVISL